MERADVENRTGLPSHDHPASDKVNLTRACCITGMHRSGTSIVARLLYRCGMFLGPEAELNQPAPDNAEGHYENPEFVRLNDEIIAQFGGRWDEAPGFPEGWEFAPQASAFLERAEDLVSQLRNHNSGWKDPRTSLTLPFWQRLLPDLKVVVCVRNPLEVARSLFLRGDLTSPSQFQLWLSYYRQLLSATQPANRLVTHYQSYFQDARAELRRVLDWLDLEVSDDVVERACAEISAGLRHHYVLTQELIGADVPDEVLSSYWSLCAEAGPIYRHVRKREAAGELKHTAPWANEVNTLMNEVQQLRSSCAATEQRLNEVLNSKSFRLVSFYWRLRRRK